MLTACWCLSQTREGRPVIETLLFYCQGPCVSHLRKEIRRESRVVIVFRRTPKNEARENAAEALWMGDRHGHMPGWMDTFFVEFVGCKNNMASRMRK